MPAQTTQATDKIRDLASGVVRYGKGCYIIDGEEVKGIMLRWKRYKPRIEAMEREAGFMINKRGHRVSMKLFDHAKRNADEAELPVEADAEQRESETDSGSHEATSGEAEEAKKKSPPKPKKKPVKRPRMKY